MNTIRNIRIFFISFIITIGFSQCVVSSKHSSDKNRYQSQDLSVSQLSENTFVHISYLQTQDFGKVACNGLIVKHGNSCLIFDTPTQNNAAHELIHWIKNQLHCNIVAIIPTHFHDDCLGGLKAFHEANIPSYAHTKTIALANKNHYEIPQHAFSDSLWLSLGDEKVLVKYFGEGHTQDNVIGYFPKDKVLFGGCLVKELNTTKGYLGDANVKTWSATVSKVKQNFPEVKYVVPGHGSTGGVSLLDYTINLFKDE